MTILEHNHKNKKNTTNKLIISIALNVLITLTEIVGGILSRSLALLSDAFHNLSDVAALLISFIALKISEKPASKAKTYGYKRAEILAALFNTITICLICGYIIYEAIKRLLSPEEIKTELMLAVAVIGFLGNGISVILLFREKEKNINIKSAFLHLLGDTLSSIAVITVAIVMSFKKIYFLDPVLSILISLYIIKESITIFMETVNILMQAAPKGIDTKIIVKRLKNEKSLGIIDVHHVHIWSMAPGENMIEAHIVIKSNISLKKANQIVKKVSDILSCDFGFVHTTLQVEHKGFDHEPACKF